MMKYKSTFLAVVLVMCALFAVAHADVKYTIATKYTFTKSSYGPAGSSEETNTNFVTAEKSRRELVQNYGIYTSKEILIFRCDLHQEFRLDDSLRIYTVSKLVPALSTRASPSELKEDIPEMTTITNYAIKKLGSEKINGFDTQGYEVITTTHYSGDFGNREGKSTMKWWLADVQGWQSCNEIDSPLPASFTHVVNFHGTERRRYTEKNTGDVEEMNKLRTKFPVRIEGTSEHFSKASNEGTIDQNVTSYLPNEKFDSSLFEVPAGYREVSPEEYDKLRSAAERKAIQDSKKAKAQQ
jgi:hypothetical protein